MAGNLKPGRKNVEREAVRKDCIQMTMLEEKRLVPKLVALEPDPERLMELSATVAKKRAERRIDSKVTVVTPEIDKALLDAGFHFERTDAYNEGRSIGSGYSNDDGRAILVEQTGAWVLMANGLESGGATADLLLAELAKPAPKRATKKAIRLNMARTRGEHAATALKTRHTTADKKSSPIRALEVLHEVEAEAAAQRAAKVAAAVPGVPVNVVRAVEMLGSVTGGRFTLRDLRGDKNYGHRLALLKKLFDRDRVLVAETGINNLVQAFHSTVGAAGKCHATQDADFSARCKALLSKVHDVKLAAAKAAKRTVKSARHAAAPVLIVPGVILPRAKKLSARARKDAAASERAALKVEVAHAEPTAQPNIGTKNLTRLEAHFLRLLTHANGLVSLKLERWNSQGAMHIWKGDDNRVLIGVLTPALARNVKVQTPDLDAIKILVSEWLDSKSVKKTAEIAYVLRDVMCAVNRTQESFALATLPYQLPVPRSDAAEPAITTTSVKLLEDAALGTLLVQLERMNSQGALVVYNNGMQVGVGVCPPEILETLRQVPVEVNLVTAVKQLLNPAVPSVPVTPTAARHLTAVLHCKENIVKSDKVSRVEVAASGKKFAAKAAAKTTEKSVKRTAEKKATAERKSSLFRLLNESKAAWSAFKTQKAEITAAFVKLGAVGKKAPGVTRAALIAALPKISDKNISFYLSVWQKAEPAIVEKLAAAE